MNLPKKRQPFENQIKFSGFQKAKTRWQPKLVQPFDYRTKMAMNREFEYILDHLNTGSFECHISIFLIFKWFQYSVFGTVTIQKLDLSGSPMVQRILISNGNQTTIRKLDRCVPF
jgi:hypothetical protein